MKLPVLALLFVLTAVSAKVIPVKMKNPATEHINVLKDEETEAVISKNQTFMKDLETGYSAVKIKGNKDCFITEDDPEDTQSDANQKNNTPKKQQVQYRARRMVESSEPVKVTTMTDEQRAQVGEKLIQFCGNHRLVLASKDDDARNKRHFGGCGMQRQRCCSTVYNCCGRIYGRCIQNCPVCNGYYFEYNSVCY